jgi:beta-glucosidase
MCPAVEPDLANEYGMHVYIASLLYNYQWLILLSTLFYFMHRAIVAIIRSHQESVYWLWDNGGDNETVARVVINTNVEALEFPSNFLFGVSTSAHQIEGGDAGLNQWSSWETTKDAQGRSRIKDGSRVQSAGQHWLRVDDDVKLLKELGVNSYRFSIEWSKVQPSPTEWNANAIQHYSDEVDQLLSNQIQPIITLQHFTIPTWFDELGGFEKAENIHYFVTFAERMFTELRGRVQLWVTVNEPFFYSFNGYMSGSFPPGKTSPALCGKVLRNLLEAHVQTYTRLKSLMEYPRDSNMKIGIVHCVYRFDCWNPLNPFDWFISRHLNHLFNEAVLTFFQTGHYHWRPIGHTNTHWSNPSAVKALDFIGLNYHSHSFVRYRFKSFFYNNPIEIKLPHTSLTLMSDATNATIYPEGLYRSIMQLSTILPHTPIIVTENGIADALDDRRHLYLRRHMYALSRAIADGANVIGYLYWTLFDSFEWNEGESLKFGLYALDKRTQTRTLRDGSKYYRDVCKRFARRVIDKTGVPNSNALESPPQRTMVRSASANSFSSNSAGHSSGAVVSPA